MIVVHFVLPLILLSAAIYVVLYFQPGLVQRNFVPAAKLDKKQKHVLFVTAHPDDECMFFAPTISALQQQNTMVSILCLSTGDSAGLGAVRKTELVRSAVSMGLAAENVIIVDDPSLPDSPHKAWNAALVARTVEAVCAAGDVDAIFTFDGKGVSGHANHIAAYVGVKHMAMTAQRFKFHPVNVYALESVGVVRKYASVLDMLFSLGTFWAARDSLVFVADLKAYARGVDAMRMHESQYVWFRKLYVTFSRYMFINTYNKIN
ncbi:N-acetylglucosaminyl-phosphatidylinositol de-N-acetylase-like protein [Linderina pennispora]|uniref:N-acetylglucosaminylphosphatidylinositol deacetylase n=1 Tax=Linderina pennispora TaxID=61395 RepID=A0A1Y1W9W8_9FUNG|nr:N-acetylglucosaminyl-phosphatidylinositol de-N-acetylase-like protein [Linderina pennispora]ORX70340.1 N-acetylglucosaminyl-phosphatidylinositol de-N-acetylase-like protein [Linderina pennispora]